MKCFRTANLKNLCGPLTRFILQKKISLNLAIFGKNANKFKEKRLCFNGY